MEGDGGRGREGESMEKAGGLEMEKKIEGGRWRKERSERDRGREGYIYMEMEDGSRVMAVLLSQPGQVCTSVDILG